MKQILFLFIVRALPAGLSILNITILKSTSGVNGAIAWATLIALVSFSSGLSRLGFETLILKNKIVYDATPDSTQMIWTLATPKLILSMMIGFVISIIANFYSLAPSVSGTALAFFFLWIAIAALSSNAILVDFKRHHLPTPVSYTLQGVLPSALQTIFILSNFYISSFQFSLLFICAASNVIACIISIIALRVSLKFIAIAFIPSIKKIHSLLWDLRHFWLSAFLGLILSNTDIIILQNTYGLTPEYLVFSRFTIGFLLIHNVLTFEYSPRFARWRVGSCDFDDFRDFRRRHIIFMALGAFVALAMTPVICDLFGAEIAPTLTILLFYLCLQFASAALGPVAIICIFSGYEKAVSFTSIISIAIVLLASICLLAQNFSAPLVIACAYPSITIINKLLLLSRLNTIRSKF